MFGHLKKTICLASLPFLIVGAASGADQSDYGGKMSLTAVSQEVRPLDAAGHVVIAEVFKAKQTSTGRISWMDGADVVFTDVAELDKGNGVAHGVGADVKDGVTVPWTYVNNIKTVLVDGKPLTTTEGTVMKIGKSPMKNVRSKCTFTSQTTLECEWWGDADKTAAR